MQLTGEGRIDTLQLGFYVQPVLFFQHLSASYTSLQRDIVIRRKEFFLHRLYGLSHHLRTILLHVLNLLQLESQFAFLPAIDDGCLNGDDNHNGNNDREAYEPMNHVFLLSLF